MSHAETCPICKGVGNLMENDGTALNYKKCHGCNGKGWITVEDKPETNVTFVTNDSCSGGRPTGGGGN